MIQISDSGSNLRGSIVTLTEDVYAGFQQAVNNSQIRLAMDYATKIIEAQRAAIQALEEKVEALSDASATVVNNTVVIEEQEPAKKPAAKKAASRKVGGKNPPPKSKVSEEAEAADDSDSE